MSVRIYADVICLDESLDDVKVTTDYILPL